MPRNEPQEASHNMLEKPNGLLIHKLGNHIAKDGADRIETLVSLADVLKTHVVKQNLLDDEDSNSLAEFRTSLHDAQAKRNDLSGEKEVNNLRRVILDKSTNHAKGGQAKIFEGTRF